MLTRFFTLIFVICQFKALCQIKDHPETYNPGCCSEKTYLPYSYDKNEKEQYLIYEGNKVSEKSLFYEGKYDAWKSKFNKENRLFDQIYIIPPATLPLGKGKFLDQTEVANIHYDEFLYFMRRDSGKYADQEYLPELENKYKTKYFASPEFYFFPVTGVNIQHAQAYCQWRADKFNITLKDLLRGSPKKYRYKGRLPTLSEWQLAAGSAFAHVKEKSYKLGGGDIDFLREDVVASRFASSSELDTKIIHGYNVNFHVDPSQGVEIEIPQYIYSFEPNKRGFYNLYGNVMELIQEGYAVGGSFLTPFKKEVLFDPTNDIQAYKMDVGFRCILEVKRRRL